MISICSHIHLPFIVKATLLVKFFLSDLKLQLQFLIVLLHQEMVFSQSYQRFYLFTVRSFFSLSQMGLQVVSVSILSPRECSAEQLLEFVPFMENAYIVACKDKKE